MFSLANLLDVNQTLPTMLCPHHTAGWTYTRRTGAGRTSCDLVGIYAQRNRWAWSRDYIDKPPYPCSRSSHRSPDRSQSFLEHHSDQLRKEHFIINHWHYTHDFKNYTSMFLNQYSSKSKISDCKVWLWKFSFFIDFYIYSTYDMLQRQSKSNVNIWDKDRTNKNKQIHNLNLNH